MDDLYGTLPSEMSVLQTTDSDLITLQTQQGVGRDNRGGVENPMFQCFILQPPKHHVQ